MLNILRELLVDVFILVACLSLGSMLARDRITTVNFKNGIILGALCGALGEIVPPVVEFEEARERQ